MNIAAKLRRLREAFECEGGNIADVEVPAVLLLFDVCQALELDDLQKHDVLGAAGTTWLAGVMDTPISPTGNGRTR